MTEDNLKDFAVNWILTGLLLTSLITFAIFFMYSNNPIGLGTNANYVFNQTSYGINVNLYEVEGKSNELLNITAQTNPETSFLGSRDSVATSYKMKDAGVSNWEQMKMFISWVLVGDMGEMLIIVFGGIIGFLSIYYITKWIRTGA
jgi:hypothetical protein